MKIDRTCRDAACAIPIVPIGHTPPPGYAAHEGRGLCRSCYAAHRAGGTLGDYPPITWRRTELYAEWEILRDRGMSRREAAGHLGVTFAALEQAILRTRRGWQPRGAALPRRDHAEILRQWNALLARGVSKKQARKTLRICRRTVARVLAGTGQE